MPDLSRRLRLRREDRDGRGRQPEYERGDRKRRQPDGTSHQHPVRGSTRRSVQIRSHVSRDGGHQSGNAEEGPQSVRHGHENVGIPMGLR